MEKVATIGRWPLYGGLNEWGKALLGLTKVAFIERWPYYRVATIRRFHCIYILEECLTLMASGSKPTEIWPRSSSCKACR